MIGAPPMIETFRNSPGVKNPIQRPSAETNGSRIWGMLTIAWPSSSFSARSISRVCGAVPTRYTTCDPSGLIARSRSAPLIIIGSPDGSPIAKRTGCRAGCGLSLLTVHTAIAVRIIPDTSPMLMPAAIRLGGRAVD